MGEKIHAWDKTLILLAISDYKSKTGKNPEKINFDKAPRDILPTSRRVKILFGSIDNAIVEAEEMFPVN